MTNTYHRVGNGPHPVLVLHGWFGDAHSFEEIEPWLNVHAFNYVFMDYRGYGACRKRAAHTRSMRLPPMRWRLLTLSAFTTSA